MTGVVKSSGFSPCFRQDSCPLEYPLEVQQLEPKQLTPWDRNPRKNDHAVDAVAESIKQFGFNVPIICDQNLRVVAGHVRLKAAKKLRMERVPVIQLHLTDAQRDAFALADNKTAEIADWDYDLLADIITDLDTAELDLPSLGFSDAELQAILEPEEDFDFGQFEEHLLLTVERDHAFFPVKIPIHAKEDMKNAVKEFAKAHGIRDKSEAMLAGRVLASLLGVPAWTER